MADTSSNQNAIAPPSGNTTALQLLQQGWVANIDAQTEQQLKGLGQIRQARINQLQRQATALSAQKGATDPEVVSLQKSIQTQLALVSVLGVVGYQASTPAPTAPANGWILYGFVRDQNLQPAPKLTVYLVNEAKEWLRNYGYAFTDATGYFILSYAPDASIDKERAPTSESVYLEVSSQARQPLYIDSSAFTLAVGAAQYREVVLSGQGVLGSPPAGSDSAPPAAR
jgi:hypothetical protein